MSKSTTPSSPVCSGETDVSRDVALSAAVAARESLLSADAVVEDTLTGEISTFTSTEMEEFWA